MVDKDSLMVHNKLTNAVVPRSRSGKTPRALRFEEDDFKFATNAWIYDVEQAPYAHVYHCTQYLEWTLGAKDGYTHNAMKKWFDTLETMELKETNLIRGATAQKKWNVANKVQDDVEDLANRPDETCISNVLYVIALISAGQPHPSKDPDFLVRAGKALRTYISLYFRKRQVVLKVQTQTQHEDALRVDDAMIPWDMAEAILGDSGKVKDVFGEIHNKGGERPDKIHLADLLVSLERFGGLKGRRNRMWWPLRQVLKQVARQMDMTRVWKMWEVMKFRELPLLVGKTGRAKARSTEAILEVAQLAVEVPGLDANRLTRAAMAWEGRRQLAEAAGSSGGPRVAGPRRSRSLGGGDDRGDGGDGVDGVGGGSHQRPMVCQGRRLPRTDHDWPMVANIIATGRRDMPPKPRVAGFTFDGMKLEGEEIVTNMAGNPESRNVNYMPVCNGGGSYMVCALC